MAVALCLLSGCNSKPANEARLRISMIPTTDPSKALRENQPLLAYWQKQTGQTPDLTIPTSYAAVVEALVNNKVDIAYLGGFTYVQASARAGVKPLVQRTIDQQFHSFFITQTGFEDSFPRRSAWALRLWRRELDLRPSDAPLLHAAGEGRS